VGSYPIVRASCYTEGVISANDILRAWFAEGIFFVIGGLCTLTKVQFRQFINSSRFSSKINEFVALFRIGIIVKIAVCCAASRVIIKICEHFIPVVRT
jgi:hypothetical protein